MYKPLKHHRILGEHRPQKSSIVGAWIVALLFIFLGLMTFYTMMTFDDYDLSARISLYYWQYGLCDKPSSFEAVHHTRSRDSC